MIGQSSSSITDFEIISKLGQGSYSSVYLAIRKSTREKLALKRVKLEKLSDRERQNSLNEVRLLASVSSPYIVGYKDAFFDSPSQSLCVLMEYVDGGDLLQRIREHKDRKTAFTEDDVWSFALQMLKGLQTLHEMSILHRDLKSANVFLGRRSRILKLGDLNVAKVAKTGFLSTQTGTPYYASPEVWRDDAYDSKSDVWSFGCVLYEMTSLKPPFRAPDMKGLYKKVQNGAFQRIPALYSDELADFVALCLTVDPKERPGCDELLELRCLRVREHLDPHYGAEESAPAGNLLGTILFPKNLNKLPALLPKPASTPQPEVSPDVRGRMKDSKRALSSASLAQQSSSQAKKGSRTPTKQLENRSRDQSSIEKGCRTPQPKVRSSSKLSSRPSAPQTKEKSTGVCDAPLPPKRRNINEDRSYRLPISARRSRSPVPPTSSSKDLTSESSLPRSEACYQRIYHLLAKSQGVPSTSPLRPSHPPVKPFI